MAANNITPHGLSRSPWPVAFNLQTFLFLLPLHSLHYTPRELLSTIVSFPWKRGPTHLHKRIVTCMRFERGLLWQLGRLRCGRCPAAWRRATAARWRLGRVAAGEPGPARKAAGPRRPRWRRGGTTTRRTTRRPGGGCWRARPRTASRESLTRWGPRIGFGLWARVAARRFFFK